jgi:hypothetical protein
MSSSWQFILRFDSRHWHYCTLQQYFGATNCLDTTRARQKRSRTIRSRLMVVNERLTSMPAFLQAKPAKLPIGMSDLSSTMRSEADID